MILWEESFDQNREIDPTTIFAIWNIGPEHIGNMPINKARKLKAQGFYMNLYMDNGNYRDMQSYRNIPVGNNFEGAFASAWEMDPFDFDYYGNHGKLFGSSERFWTNPDHNSNSNENLLLRYHHICGLLQAKENEEPHIYKPIPYGLCKLEGIRGHDIFPAAFFDTKLYLRRTERDMIVCDKKMPPHSSCVSPQCKALFARIKEYQNNIESFAKSFPKTEKYYSLKKLMSLELFKKA